MLFHPVAAVIPNGASLSNIVALSDAMIVTGLQLPAAWTTAGLSFQASHDGVRFGELFYDGAAVSVAAAADRYVQLPPDVWLGVRFFRVRSGTSGAPVNQAGQRTIQIMLATG